MKIKIYILFLVIFSTGIFAQQRVQTSIDTTQQVIGSQFNLTLKTVVAKDEVVQFPKANNFGRLEVIRSYVVDTVAKDDKYELIKKYGLTQFDSGSYTIPQLKVFINKNVYFTDSIAIEIQNVAVDTLKQKMYDIRPIIEAKSSNNWIYWTILIIVLFAALGYYIYNYFKNRKPKVVEVEVYKTPIEKATMLLNSLEQKELWQKGAVKEYYSELTDIARNYIEEAIQIPAMESTTSELIEALQNVSKKKKMKISPETAANLQAVLMQADLVKFAKSKPLDFEIEEDKKKIQKTILVLDNAIPKVEEIEEEDILNEAQRRKLEEERKKKEKKKKIQAAIAVVVGFIVGFFLILTVAKGPTYVKDFIFGNYTKSLFENEWILSEYGNPAIKIETPEVLKRTDPKEIFNENIAAVISEMQVFSFGKISDPLSVSISTLTYKEKKDIDLDLIAEEFLKDFESKGAQNLIVKTEDFSTQERVEGRKCYGTMNVLDKENKSGVKIYYELLVFKQNNGLQYIMITHEEGNEFGKKISDKVINSVELKRASI